MTHDEFYAKTLRGLRHLYHGEQADRTACYTVIAGDYPAGLSGRLFTTVFSYQAVYHERQNQANPHMLSAPGRLLSIDLDPRPGLHGSLRFDVGMRTLANAAWHLRTLAPQTFVRSDFTELSWFGLADLSNTSPIPMFANMSEAAGVRLLIAYDAGRPAEISPTSLDYLTPIGKAKDYMAALGSSFTPMLMTTGHPVYDPENALLFYTHLVPRVASFLKPDQPITADLYLMTWDGGVTGPSRPMRALWQGQPVVLEQASAHQMCLTRNYVLIFNACLVLSVGSILEPVLSLVAAPAGRGRQGMIARLLEHAYQHWRPQLSAASPRPRCRLYILHKADIRTALRDGRRHVPVRQMVELPWELTHAVADFNDAGDLLTVFCQHNIGADPAEQMEAGDALVHGGVVPDDLRGLFSSATDLNQVRKHVIDVARGRVTTTAFPDPQVPDHFAYGLNLLPPLQVLPYRARRPDGPLRYDLLSCIEQWEATYWVSAGWIPQTMSTRVFDIFRHHRQRAGCPPQRLVPEADYVQRIQETTNTVRFFRLDRDLRLESAYVFAPGTFMAAPVFVPRHDAMSVRHGWLVGQVWGPEQPHMELWVWDAARPLEHGPICKLGPAPGERGLQPGFPLHSAWIDRAGLDHWCQTDYRVPLIELPNYLKVCEFGTMALGMLRALLRQTFGPA